MPGRRGNHIGSIPHTRLRRVPGRAHPLEQAFATIGTQPDLPAFLAGTPEALRERVRLLEAVVDNFPGGISLFDTDLRMVLCNEQQRCLLEYPEQLFASGWPTLEQIFRFNATRGEYGPGDVEEHVRLRMTLAHERRPHVFERTRPNGTVLEIRGVPLQGGGFLTTYLDVTDQRRSHALIAHMAHHDALTNLPNRVLFNDRLQQAATRVRRGEAFAAAEAAALARRGVKALAAPYQLAGKTIAVGTSIGIAVAPVHGADPEELLKKADHALYRCKADGRGSYAFYQSGAAGLDFTDGSIGTLHNAANGRQSGVA